MRNEVPAPGEAGLGWVCSYPRATIRNPVSVITNRIRRGCGGSYTVVSRRNSGAPRAMTYQKTGYCHPSCLKVPYSTTV